MAKIDKFETAAVAVALTGPGCGGGRKNGRFRVGAVISDGRRVVSASYNSMKTHPKLKKYSPWPHKHAERAAILKLGIEHCSGLDLFVARVKVDGTIGLSKPCEGCMKLIKDAGIRRLYYTTDQGQFILANGIE